MKASSIPLSSLSIAQKLIPLPVQLLTKEEDEAHNAATIRGGVEGLVGAAALTLPVLLYANKRVGWYQALPKNWKASFRPSLVTDLDTRSC